MKVLHQSVLLESSMSPLAALCQELARQRDWPDLMPIIRRQSPLDSSRSQEVCSIRALEFTIVDLND